MPYTPLNLSDIYKSSAARPLNPLQMQQAMMNKARMGREATTRGILGGGQNPLEMAESLMGAGNIDAASAVLRQHYAQQGEERTQTKFDQSQSARETLMNNGRLQDEAMKEHLLGDNVDIVAYRDRMGELGFEDHWVIAQQMAKRAHDLSAAEAAAKREGLEGERKVAEEVRLAAARMVVNFGHVSEMMRQTELENERRDLFQGDQDWKDPLVAGQNVLDTLMKQYGVSFDIGELGQKNMEAVFLAGGVIPEGFEIDADGVPQKIVEGDKPSVRETKISDLISQYNGMTRKQATAIVDGFIETRISQETGDIVLTNIADQTTTILRPRAVGDQDDVDVVEAAPPPPGLAMDIYKAAEIGTGLWSGIRQAANVAAGFLGLSGPAGDTSKARNVVRQFSFFGRSVLGEAANEGRLSNQQLDWANELLVEPSLGKNPFEAAEDMLRLHALFTRIRDAYRESANEANITAKMRGDLRDSAEKFEVLLGMMGNPDHYGTDREAATDDDPNRAWRDAKTFEGKTRVELEALINDPDYLKTLNGLEFDNLERTYNAVRRGE
jgi:hypothetical protein